MSKEQPVKTTKFSESRFNPSLDGYANDVRHLAEGARNANRYLLVFKNARHNLAPNPIPAAASAHPDDFSAYAEQVWDSARINNINQHFVLACAC